MTAALLDRHAEDVVFERAHLHIDKFAASDERDTAFALFPDRAREAEKLGLIVRGRHGGLERVEGAGDAYLASLGRLLVPHITAEMMLSVGADVIGEVDHAGNLLMNAGINSVLGNRLVGGTAQAYDATHTALGAGDTNTPAANSQTDLAAAVNAANRYVQLVDSLPTFSTQVLTCIATFATGNGNFAWAEWAIGQNTASGANAITASMLNRKVAALGTKTSAASWALTVTLTFS